MPRQHNERCKECKKRIQQLLEALYGDVITNKKLELSSQPDAYSATPHGSALLSIFEALQAHRGHRDFVRVKTLPNVDYYIVSPGFILEFDESQHFTALRATALSAYPAELDAGFDTTRWKELSEKLNKRDNDPVYRDEQRAWYDTLRDFAPSVLGLLPTVRLYARDYPWCTLDASTPSDIARFQTMASLPRPDRLSFD